MRTRRSCPEPARAWKAAELAPLGLHEARHTFASYAIAAGANAKAVTTALGHSSVSITFDRYGHLCPGHEDELRGLLDTYLQVHAAADAEGNAN